MVCINIYFLWFRHPCDPSARRYIMSFQAGDPFVVNNVEFITLTVKGQSFMLHQIRKMVSAVIALMRKIIEKEHFDKFFNREKYEISKAPGLGPMLNIVRFQDY